MEQFEKSYIISKNKDHEFFEDLQFLDIATDYRDKFRFVYVIDSQIWTTNYYRMHFVRKDYYFEKITPGKYKLVKGYKNKYILMSVEDQEKDENGCKRNITHKSIFTVLPNSYDEMKLIKSSLFSLRKEKNNFYQLILNNLKGIPPESHSYIWTINENYINDLFKTNIYNWVYIYYKYQDFNIFILHETMKYGAMIALTKKYVKEKR